MLSAPVVLEEEHMVAVGCGGRDRDPGMVGINRRETDPASDRLCHGGWQPILGWLDYMPGMKGR